VTTPNGGGTKGQLGVMELRLLSFPQHLCLWALGSGKISYFEKAEGVLIYQNTWEERGCDQDGVVEIRITS